MFCFPYNFDEQIEIDGIRVGHGFSGTAYLIEEGADFYVSAIFLDGEKVTRIPGRVLPIRTESRVELERDSWMFNTLAAAIYGSQDAREKFAEELAMERAA